MLNPSAVIKLYLKESGFSVSEFARICKISKMTIYNCLRKNAIHSTTAQKIEEGTKGAIKFESLTDKRRPEYYFTRIRVYNYRALQKNISS